jgi:hypothetical protein
MPSTQSVAGVEQVAQTVTENVETQDWDGHGEARK